MHGFFPVRRGTYNRVLEAAHYSFMNRNASALEAYFKPGLNEFDLVVAADQPWEERPFSRVLRFLAYETQPQPAPPAIEPIATVEKAVSYTHLTLPTN